MILAGNFTLTNVETWLDITSDLNVNGGITMTVGAADYRRYINHTSGTVDVNGAFNVGASGNLGYLLTGPGAVLNVADNYTFTLAGRSTTLEVADGARMEAYDFTQANSTAGGAGGVLVHDGGSVLVRRNTIIGNSNAGSTFVITNGSFTANGYLLMNIGVDARIEDGAQVNVLGALQIGQYSNSNGDFKQTGGSVEANTLAISGISNGTAEGTAQNNVYTLSGGTLTVNSTAAHAQSYGTPSALIGQFGHAIFQQSGGSADFKGDVTVRSSTAPASMLALVSQIIFDEGAEAILRGTLRLGYQDVVDKSNGAGELRVVGNAAQNGRLSFNNVYFGMLGIYAPVITQNGFTPIHVGNQLRVFDGFVVRPELDGAVPLGDYTILTWNALNTTTPEQLEAWVKLAEDVDRSHWKIIVDTEGKKATLRYFATGSLLLVR
ncbi:MAG: hypothetical protein FWF96_01510 [Kiritimatiellaeota bacterium]|nr:hypothetical protein [Kiritimatiellota bacterium]